MDTQEVDFCTVDNLDHHSKTKNITTIHSETLAYKKGDFGTTATFLLPYYDPSVTYLIINGYGYWVDGVEVKVEGKTYTYTCTFDPLYSLTQATGLVAATGNASDFSPSAFQEPGIPSHEVLAASWNLPIIHNASVDDDETTAIITMRYINKFNWSLAAFRDMVTKIIQDTTALEKSSQDGSSSSNDGVGWDPSALGQLMIDVLSEYSSESKASLAPVEGQTDRGSGTALVVYLPDANAKMIDFGVQENIANLIESVGAYGMDIETWLSPIFPDQLVGGTLDGEGDWSMGTVGTDIYDKKPTTLGIGLALGGWTKAYPLRTGNWADSTDFTSGQTLIDNWNFTGGNPFTQGYHLSLQFADNKEDFDVSDYLRRGWTNFMVTYVPSASKSQRNRVILWVKPDGSAGSKQYVGELDIENLTFDIAKNRYAASLESSAWKEHTDNALQTAGKFLGLALAQFLPPMISGDIISGIMGNPVQKFASGISDGYTLGEEDPGGAAVWRDAPQQVMLWALDWDQAQKDVKSRYEGYHLVTPLLETVAFPKASDAGVKYAHAFAQVFTLTGVPGWGVVQAKTLLKEGVY